MLASVPDLGQDSAAALERRRINRGEYVNMRRRNPRLKVRVSRVFCGRLFRYLEPNCFPRRTSPGAVPGESCPEPATEGCPVSAGHASGLPPAPTAELFGEFGMLPHGFGDATTLSWQRHKLVSPFAQWLVRRLSLQRSFLFGPS